MPIFEFFCQKCKSSFEELVYSDEKIICPKCKSGDIVKNISGFATQGTDSSSSGGGCSSCGGGNCSSCG